MSQMGQFDYLITPFATITGNSGDVVFPLNNNINIMGGKHLNFDGDNATGTLTLTLDGELADTYTTDDGDAVPANFIMFILGGPNINTSASGNYLRINLDTDITMFNNGTIRTGTTAADTFFLQAYDVDGTAYKTFATLTANNTPTMDLDTAVTIGTSYIYRAGGTDIAVADGGTGASTFTQNGVIYGNGTNALGATAEGATGTVLIGTTGAAPSYSANPTLTSVLATTFDTNVATAGVTLAGTTLSADGSDADININITAKGAGTVIIDELTLTTDLAVSEGGTGASTFTDHGVLLGSGTAAITATAVGTNGQILTGVTSGDPTWTTSSYPSTVSKGDILAATSDNVIGVITGATTAGYVLMANGATNTPTFQVLPASGIATLNGDSGSATGAAVTIAGGSNLTSSATASTVTIDLDNSPTVSGTMTALTLATSTAATNLSLNANTITSSGSDTNVDINFVAKGVGGFTFDGIQTGWSDSQWHLRQSQVQTTDATPTALVTIALVEGEMITINATINGFQNDFTDACGATCTMTCYRPTGGNVTQIGEEIINMNSTSTAVISADVNVGTQSMVIYAAGVTAETWNWVSTHQYMFTKTNA